MGVGNWIAIGMFTIAQITTLIITYINLRVKIKEMEIKIENMKESMYDNRKLIDNHKKENERTFDKFEGKIDAVYDVINEVKNILIAKNFN